MTMTFEQRRNRVDQPYSGIPTFLRSPISTDLDTLDADIAIMGVPSDDGSPDMAGSRFGPRALREHSLRFAGGGRGGYYDPETRREYLVYEMENDRIVDTGDADCMPTNVVGTFDNITAMTRAILDRGAMPVILGGDHAITYPVVRAFTEQLHVIHFDAHLDYAPFVHDLRFTNGHAFRHISPMPHVESLVQAGIRSLRNTRTMMDDSIADGNEVVTMSEFRAGGPKAIAETVPKGANCYVSIDVDVLDMPLVPGCVSAEPNGMTYAELRDTLAAIAAHTNVIGFDFVEVNPQLDVGTGITAYLGAHTVIEFLGQICDQPGWVARRETLGWHCQCGTGVTWTLDRDESLGGIADGTFDDASWLKSRLHVWMESEQGWFRDPDDIGLRGKSGNRVGLHLHTLHLFLQDKVLHRPVETAPNGGHWESIDSIDRRHPVPRSEGSL